MRVVGIEAMNLHAGSACVDVMHLARHRGIDTNRFDNLLMRQKSVALPHEDPVTFAVNAAWPIVQALPEAERFRLGLMTLFKQHPSVGIQGEGKD